MYPVPENIKRCIKVITYNTPDLTLGFPGLTPTNTPLTLKANLVGILSSFFSYDNL